MQIATAVFVAVLLLAVILAIEARTNRQSSCDACRLDRDGEAHYAVPHTHSGPNAITHDGTDKREFGEVRGKSVPHNVTRGEKTDERKRTADAARNAIRESRTRRIARRRATLKAEEEITKEVERKRAEYIRESYQEVSQAVRAPQIASEVQVHQEPWEGVEAYSGKGWLHIYLSKDQPHQPQSEAAPSRSVPPHAKR